MKKCTWLALLLGWLWPVGAALAGTGSAAVGAYRELRAGTAVVLYRDPDSASAAQYLQWAVAFRPRDGILTGWRLAEVTICLAADENEFQRLSGGALPEWGLAFAVPSSDLVIVRSPRIATGVIEEPRVVLNHELSHVFLDQALRPASIPRWFQEGYALWSAEMWGLDDMFETSVALTVGSFLPFRELTDGFPQPEALARRAYLQSYTVVDYLATNWNEAQRDLLLQRWRESGDLDTALRLSLGLTLERFEAGWREWVGVRYGWLRLLGSATLLWIVAAGLFLLVFVSRRRRYSSELEKMKRIESRYRLSGPWAVPPPQRPARRPRREEQDEPEADE
ncbi:hypothetical protein LLH00_03885 [bacterium]|nr:hypothetical protein [bacterium]